MEFEILSIFCSFFYRFSKENRPSNHQFTLIPFGQGPRMCPGQKLAQITLKILVLSLLRKFRLSTYSETEVRLFFHHLFKTFIFVICGCPGCLLVKIESIKFDLDLRPILKLFMKMFYFIF